jgi:hypothetical protein
MQPSPTQFIVTALPRFAADLALATTMITAVAVSPAVSAPIDLPPDGSLTYSFVIDEGTVPVHETGEIKAWGGGGIEPMVDIHLEMTKTGSLPWGSFTSDERSKDIYLDHRPQAVGPLPEGFDGNIPVLLQCRGSGVGHATVEIYGESIFCMQANLPEDDPSGYRENTMLLTMTLGQTSTIRVHAWTTVGVNYQQPDGTVTAHEITSAAFLYVDPSWEFASSFAIFEQPTALNSDWVEVTRNWAVPEPATGALLAAGVFVLAARRRRS